ncbi:hypothetical protein [Streptomyces sichuanensis]|uniref:hypothetical protein n=1 Tax=Streptomyces sichuanensis TaxID=2871810 RepID=UPI001CE2913D|nr:hypothetical protein [Streptomyces sichuanensis]
MTAALFAWLGWTFVAPARLAAWARDHFVPAEYGLVPREQLDPRRAGPPMPAYRHKEKQAIADASWEGDWRPAAAYVEAAGQDWDERWSRLEFLQQVADDGDAWLDDWRRAQPESCAAATLHAQMLLHHAWRIRGTEYADKVPAERMRLFRELLPDSMRAARAATLLAPHDPSPWVVMVTAARGLRYQPQHFRPLWQELVARAPHHYAGHWQALQYWCAKWYGSNKLMLEFAEQAVRHAPAGSPLAGIYLHALDELAERSGTSALRTSRRTKRLLEDVARSLHQVPGDDERLPRLRHLLAYYLGKAGRYDGALEQFRLIGPWCGAEPWAEKGDPVSAFDLARGIAAKKAKGR